MAWLEILPGSTTAAIRYLIQRYLGQYLEEKITKDQINVQIFSGVLTLENLRLSAATLNAKLADQHNWPLRFIDGHIGKFYIDIPYKKFFTDSITVTITDLELVLQPKHRNDTDQSVFESMWNSMTSSMNLAEECVKLTETESVLEPIQSVENFASIIDSILNRVKIRFINTVIIVEHIPKGSQTGVGFVLNIDYISYREHEADESHQPETSDANSESFANKNDRNTAYMTKFAQLQGVQMSTMEFPVSPTDDALKTKDPLGASTLLYTVANETVNDSLEESPKDDDDDMETSRHTIRCGQIVDRIEIVVRLKQSELLAGPKVVIEFSVGTCSMLVSPRQIYVLWEVLSGLFSPQTDACGDHNRHLKSNCGGAPMSTEDYTRIEQDLNEQMRLSSAMNRGWSTPHHCDDDGHAADCFVPMVNHGSSCCAPHNTDCDDQMSLSARSSSMDLSQCSMWTGDSSTTTTTTTCSEFTSKTSRRYHRIDTDPTADISKFIAHITSLTVILLHEDVLLVDHHHHQLAVASVQQMQRVTDHFFRALEVPDMHSDTDPQRSLDGACSHLNHLRLLAGPITFEADEKTTNNAFSFTGAMEAQRCHLFECLYQNVTTVERVDILKTIPHVHVVTTNTANGSGSSKPALRLSFKHIAKLKVGRGVSNDDGPKTHLHFQLSRCCLELDVTIMDRIMALLHNPQICRPMPQQQRTNTSYWFPPETPTKLLAHSASNGRVDVTVTTPKLLLRLRFPKTDFRPQHNLDRAPWWQRTVRPDFLQFNMSAVTVQSSFSNDSALVQHYQIECRKFDVHYYDNENVPNAVHVASGASDTAAHTTDLCQLNIRLQSPHFPTANDTKDKLNATTTTAGTAESMMQTTLIGSLMRNCLKKTDGPFSQKKVVYQSDTSHFKTGANEPEELLTPGDKQELEEFIASTTNACRLYFDVFIPDLSLQLVSKHTYELLYNRINNDLLLWVPYTSIPGYNVRNTGVDDTPKTQHLFREESSEDAAEVYSLCTNVSVQSDDSDVDSSNNDAVDTDDDSSSIFYSTYATPRPKSDTTPPDAIIAQQQSQCALRMRIKRGHLCAYTPVREVSTNNVIPEQRGELLAHLDNSLIFVVNGYQNNANIGYTCYQFGHGQLYHCGMVPMDVQAQPKKDHATAVPPHLYPILYESEAGMLIDHGGRGGTSNRQSADNSNREAFTLAVKIEKNHETHHVKHITFALGLHRMTLRHRFCAEPNSWFTQLLDLFNVHDYPIPGYQPKEILTELYLHCWDCAIDYRPLHLPMRCALTMGTFRISSHLTADVNTTALRFITEESRLFLSNRTDRDAVDLRLDYVNVLEMGLFEISLKTSGVKNGSTKKKHPHIELRAANNLIHVRTCADSAKMLAQLLTYLANNGDLRITDENRNAPTSDLVGATEHDNDAGQSIKSNSTNCSSPRHYPDALPSLSSSLGKRHTEQELIQVETNTRLITENQQERLTHLISDALNEMVVPKSRTRTIKDTKRKLSSKSKRGSQHHHNDNITPEVRRDLGAPSPSEASTSTATFDSDIEREFYIVDPQAEFRVPKLGHCHIKWLSTEAIRIVEDHFSCPKNKLDPLRTPKDFPTPVVQYTLCDMSVVWSLYGGEDFPVVPCGNLATSKPRNTTAGKPPTTIHKTPTSTAAGSSGITHHRWYQMGGRGRKHSVLVEFHLTKIKFQHEVYADTEQKASRQVLIVSEFEIFDKLESSQFNKFLCQYTSKSRPKQSNAHMLMVKSVSTRPDVNLKTQECCLKVSLLPLRFNIDQDTLLFLISFFNSFGDSTTNLISNAGPVSRQSTPVHHQAPIMTLGSNPDATEQRLVQEQAKRIVDENLLILLEDHKDDDDINSCGSEMDSEQSSSCAQPPPTSMSVDDSSNNTTVSAASDVSDNNRDDDDDDLVPIYFRKVIFATDVPILLDYHGKHFDLTHGPLPGLLMGLAQISYSELILKRIYHRHGILGVEKLFSFLLREWLADIKRNQLPRLLGGLGPMHSFVKLFQGVRDLFCMPIEQFKKDGRFLRGLHRGANSFTTSTAMAALELTTKLLHLIQITAETAFDMLTPGPSVRINPRTKNRRRRLNQPKDLREGVANAYRVMRRGLEETAGNIVQMAAHEHEQKGYSGAVGGVIRHIPPTIIKPIIIMSEATNNVLGGMRCQLVPDARKDADEKWRIERGSD